MNVIYKRLESMGWFVVCESPFELKHNDGSFASGQAANILFDELKKTSLREQFELEQQGKTSSKVELLFLPMISNILLG